MLVKTVSHPFRIGLGAYCLESYCMGRGNQDNFRNKRILCTELFSQGLRIKVHGRFSGSSKEVLGNKEVSIANVSEWNMKLETDAGCPSRGRDFSSLQVTET